MNERVLSLDVFRGLIIALMILVNNQVSLSAYPLLLHAHWNGCTIADLVFPGFLFIVGMTCVVALNHHQILQNKKKVYYSIINRTGILILLGVCLNFFPIFYWSQLRYYGILQRIAICYLIGSLIYLNTTLRTQAIFFLLLIGGYWLLMTQIPVPGHGINQLTAVGSWVSYVDQLFFSSAHLFGKTYDPEGALSTIPAIATTLSGLMVGQLLFNMNYSKQKKWLIMTGISGVFLFLGWSWSYSFPLNKNLWTSSFVLWSSGWSLLVFSFCYLLIDIVGYIKWSVPFKIFGMNALFVFIVHVILIKIQFYYKLQTPHGIYSIKEFILNIYLNYFSEPNAVLVYSFVFLLINFLLAYLLYRKKIIIKI